MEFANLRPLGVGEILDTAFRVYRNRFKDLIIAVSIPMVPLIALQVLVSLSARTDTTTTSTGTSTNVNLVLGGFGATLLIGLIAGALAEGASVRILADQYLGTSTTWQESLRFAFGRLGSIVWVALLVGVLELIGLFICVIPGVYLWAAFAVAMPVLLIENAKGSRALSRSRLLVSGRWWPTFGTLLVVWLLASFLRGISSALLTGGFVLSSGVNTSTAATALSGVISGIVTIVFAPLTAAVITIIYFDLRIRKEGFDVALMAQRLGTPPPPAVPSSWAPPAAPPPGPPGWAPPTAPPTAPPGAAPPPPAPGAPPPGPPGWTAPPNPPPPTAPPPTAPPPLSPSAPPPAANPSWPPEPTTDPYGQAPPAGEPPAEPPPA